MPTLSQVHSFEPYSHHTAANMPKTYVHVEYKERFP